MESLEACAGSSCHLSIISGDAKKILHPRDPCRRYSLGGYWQILANLGKSWRFLAILGKFLINFTSGLAKKITQSRGLLCVVAVCLRPKTEPTGTTSEAKKILQHEEIPGHLLQVRHFNPQII